MKNSMKKLLLIAVLACSASAGATTYVPVQLINPTGSSSGQAIVSNGSSSAPTWGNVTATSLVAQAANTVVANVTGSSASPTAFPMPTCNSSSSALNYTGGTGWSCGTVASSGANSNITSLSGLTTALSVAQGGTGRATLTSHGVLVGEGTSAINQLAVGTTGQMLLGATGADPAFGNNPTITGGTIDGVCIGCTTPATSIAHSQQEVDTSFTVSSPTTGQTVTIASGTETALIVPAGSLSTLTVTLPGCTSGYNGSLVRFVSTQTVTTLTLNASSGSVVDPATTLTIGAGHAYLCRGAATAWYPLY